jgi:hypothetical protein
MHPEDSVALDDEDIETILLLVDGCPTSTATNTKWPRMHSERKYLIIA